MPVSQLPIIDNCNEDIDGALDQFWFLMGCIIKPGDTSHESSRFCNLSRLCKTLLALYIYYIPHSNTDPE